MTRAGVVAVCALAASGAQAQGSGLPDLRVDMNLYPYQHSLKGDVDFTTTINASLPGRFSYFSYINMKGVTSSGSARFDRSEQNLRYAMADSVPLDLNFQGVLARGDGNDFYQLGLGWRLHDTPAFESFFERINLIYRLTFQLRRFSVDDNDAWAVEHFFLMRMPQLSDRLYLSGFVDQTFDERQRDGIPGSPIVAEVQLGLRLWRQLYAVGEYRVNQKRLSDRTNVAIGVEYKFGFDFQ